MKRFKIPAALFLSFSMLCFFLISYDTLSPLRQAESHQTTSQDLLDKTVATPSLSNTPVKVKPPNSDSLQKALARIAYAQFLEEHPFNQHKHLNYADWKSIPKADRPDLAMEQDFLRTLDPSLGYVPLNRKLKALKKVSKDLSGKAAIAGLRWKERGPNNVGGRTRALLFDPTDATHKKVWAGGIQGGLWFTTNITIDTLWTKVNDLWDNISISAIAVDPNDSLTWYLGTGEGFTAGGSSSTRGAGLWKTEDAGQTWTHLTSANGFFSTDANFHYVNDIIVRDEGSGTSALLVAIGRRFQQGAFTQDVGLYRSTDGGINFTQVLPTAPSGGRPYEPADLELDANNRIWVGTRDNSNISGGGVIAYSSTGLSGSFTLVDFSAVNNARRVEIACAPSDPDVVYAVARNGTPTDSDQDVAWFRRTLNATDATPVWEDIPIPNYINTDCSVSSDHFTRGQAFYDLILAVHPTDPATVILGGISLHKATNGTTATAGNVSFAPISYWTGDCFTFVHADEHQILFRPENPNEAIIGSDGGVSYSTNLGNSSAPNFSNRNNHYNVTQFYAVDGVNEAGSTVFIAGSQDNGSQQFQDGLQQSSLDVTGGDGGFCHIDQDNANIRITSFIRNVYNVSNDGGQTYVRVLNDQSNGLFINPSEYDDQANILYANFSSASTITRVSDVGITNVYTDLDINALNSFSAITALKASPHTNHRLFLGTSAGAILRVDDANTASPSTLELDVTPLPLGSISSIDVGGDDDELLVTYFNYGVQSVWETSDGGTTWHNKEGNLPDFPVRWGLYNPLNRDEVLLATELGVYSSDNFGTGTASAPVWEVSNTGLATVRCDMLKYRATDGLVMVATHGRGIFTSDIFSGELAEFEARQTWFVNRPLSFVDLSHKATSWAWDFDQNVNPGTDATTQHPSFTYTTPGTYTVQLSINSGASVETKTSYITILEEPVVPYAQDFNAHDGGFFPYRLDGVARTNVAPREWEWGASNSFNFNGTFATIEGANNWVTDLTENHGFVSRYALESPPFSLVNAVGDVFLTFSYRAACGAEAGFNVEYSTDQGQTWSLLGDTQASGNNPSGTSDWYNESTLMGIRSQPGFRQTSFSVFTPRFNITEFSGVADLRFRFVFGSRLNTNDGVQIDNFELEGSIALPISLLSFTGRRIDEQSVLLEWQTVTEINNRGFAIERSFDARNFERVGFVDGAGDSNQILQYEFIDSPMDSPAYYRLRQEDLDGTISISSVVFVVGSQPESFIVFPNPSQGALSFTLDSYNLEDDVLKLQLWDSKGSLIFDLFGTEKQLQERIRIHSQKLTPGMYILRIQTDRQVFTQKIVKQ